MTAIDLQDMLALVEKPSRYLGLEKNAIHKSFEKIRPRVVLAFPDLYEIGTSHFGIQILYHLLNAMCDVVAERVFAPAPDMAQRILKEGTLLSSLESGIPLNRFDILGFSLLYELNYTNILEMLSLSQIPLHADERSDEAPLVIAGGPCTCNPEPVAAFFDALAVGDGEVVFPSLVRTWQEWKKTGSAKKALLSAWRRLPGVYVPLAEDAWSGAVVQRAVASDLEACPFPNAPVVPFGRPVHDRLRIEIARGCSRGCRFCQAGMIYRPVRERSVNRIIETARQGIVQTGYEDVSLMSLSTGDYSRIEMLLSRIMNYCEPHHVAVSLPSLRAGSLTPELMGQIRRVRKTGFTIAPEAGSQRLRDVINKNITEAEIVDTVQNAFDLGWQVIKLYFMIGLPTETLADLKAIVQLVEKLRKIRGPRGHGKINVSVATFVPKPHTPFQWAPQNSLEQAGQKIEWLKAALKLPGVRFKWQRPEVSLIEGLFARGDRRMSKLLYAAWSRGCRMDGWSDYFNFSQWMKACNDVGICPEAETERRRDVDEALPWDPVDMKIDKAFLIREWQRAQIGEITPDCRAGACQKCGICDFEVLKPRYSEADEAPVCRSPVEEKPFQKLRITYRKEGPARFFSHLEMANIFLRALRRAGAHMQYSNGFHPMPRISFEYPLPVGVESRREYFYLTAALKTSEAHFAVLLNAELPCGLSVSACEAVVGRTFTVPDSAAIYEATVERKVFDRAALETFRRSDEWWLMRRTRKGKLKKIDLKAIVRRVDLLDDQRIYLELSYTPDGLVRPADVMKAVFGFSDEDVQTARTVKLAGPRERNPSSCIKN